MKRYKLLLLALALSATIAPSAFASNKLYVSTSHDGADMAGFGCAVGVTALVMKRNVPLGAAICGGSLAVGYGISSASAEESSESDLKSGAIEQAEEQSNDSNE